VSSNRDGTQKEMETMSEQTPTAVLVHGAFGAPSTRIELSLQEASRTHGLGA
jgi:hypothetical protein